MYEARTRKMKSSGESYECDMTLLRDRIYKGHCAQRHFIRFHAQLTRNVAGKKQLTHPEVLNLFSTARELAAAAVVRVIIW